MNLNNPLIINAEIFFQCAGNCSGCFLTQEERLSSNFYLNSVKNQIVESILNNPNKSHYIVGFGRGNILNMPLNLLNEFIDFMLSINKLIKNVTFEISTSLIGKIDVQIERAKHVLDKVKNSYFNVVINSEITSINFWNNWQKFYKEMENVRIKNGLTDNLGDILVLNVNPKNLPDISLLSRFLHNIKSPINISLFPFDNIGVKKDDYDNLNNWISTLLEKFANHDLNIKNFMTRLSDFKPSSLTINEVFEYIDKNQSNYIFITKGGDIVQGSLSIMGELDYPRFIEKYKINITKDKIIKTINKNKFCSSCKFVNQCIMSNSVTNLIINSENNFQEEVCLSGYFSVFQYFQGLDC